MKRFALSAISLTALLLSAACTSQPQVAKDTPLDYQRSFSFEGAEYSITLAAKPKVPRAGEPFNLTISVLDKSSRHPPHLTYTVTIIDASGRKLFVDSLHDMEGKPYKKRVTLGSSGAYALRLEVAFGMGSLKSEPFRDEFGFWVSG